MATGERPNAPDRIRTSASQGRRAMSQVRTREGPDAPDRIRTCVLWFRRPALYPTELRARDRGRTPGQRLYGVASGLNPSAIPGHTEPVGACRLSIATFEGRDRAGCDSCARFHRSPID